MNILRKLVLSIFLVIGGMNLNLKSMSIFEKICETSEILNLGLDQMKIEDEANPLNLNQKINILKFIKKNIITLDTEINNFLDNEAKYFDIRSRILREDASQDDLMLIFKLFPSSTINDFSQSALVDLLVRLDDYSFLGDVYGLTPIKKKEVLKTYLEPRLLDENFDYSSYVNDLEKLIIDVLLFPHSEMSSVAKKVFFIKHLLIDIIANIATAISRVHRLCSDIYIEITEIDSADETERMSLGSLAFELYDLLDSFYKKQLNPFQEYLIFDLEVLGGKEELVHNIMSLRTMIGDNVTFLYNLNVDENFVQKCEDLIFSGRFYLDTIDQRMASADLLDSENDIVIELKQIYELINSLYINYERRIDDFMDSDPESLESKLERNLLLSSERF